MKLSHLSLAILSAIALAACGGSGSDDHTTDPNANKPGATDQTPKQPEDKKDEDKKEDTAKEDAKIVDPTGDQVVDDISLAETSTTASQQYLRGAKSGFDRAANPNEPASATVLSGITLDVQNPQLTNIVIGRIDDKNSKGERVQVAFYAGSDSNKMSSVDSGNSLYKTLQDENQDNAQVGDRYSDFSKFGWNVTKGFVNGDSVTLTYNPLLSNLSAGFSNAYVGAVFSLDFYNELLEIYKERAETYIKNNGTVTFDDDYRFSDGTVASLTGLLRNIEGVVGKNLQHYNKEEALLLQNPNFKALGIKLVNKNKADTKNIAKIATIFGGGGVDPKKPDQKLLNDLSDAKNQSQYVIAQLNSSSLRKYGSGLYWYTTGTGDVARVLPVSAFGVPPTGVPNLGWGDRIDPVKGVVGVEAGDTNYPLNNGPTTGLVGIYKDSGKWIVRGSEDNNVRTTRIFGHYYRDPGSDGVNLLPEDNNSWLGAGTFITGVDYSKNIPNQYGLGVAPMTLNHVQYGRVTATIDDNSVAGRQGTSGWVKEHQDFANRDPKYANDADDFYFYRGTNATSIEDMAKLPTDANITYLGHALMYGIDNSFHGAGQELPNAFGNQQSYGIGNFVKANLNMGSKKFDGYVYNVWGTPTSAAVKEDKLVEFSGDVTGNTVIGTANLAYDTSKTGDLRASFYGAAADEVGGAFNSVKREDPYGPIGWGGVFGAHKTTSGNSAWLVSSEKK